MEGRNIKAMKLLGIVLAALVYVGAVVYGDVMFITVMQDTFPSGILGALAIAGAVMTAASAITLPIALHWWFSPGMQFIWGIIFWGLDVTVLALNAMLAYSLSLGAVDSTLATWAIFSPATPLLAVFGWGIAFMLDPSHKMRHAQMELESDLIDIHASQMRQAAKDKEVYSMLVEGAKVRAADYAGLMTSTRPEREQSNNGRVYANETETPAVPTVDLGRVKE